MTDQTGILDLLHVEQRGAGLPVVLLHGFSFDCRTWDDQVEAFARHHRTIRYDLRGFGRSAVPDGTPYSHAGDLHALLGALGVGRAVLVGLSLGANVALAFALEHPGAVAGLVLASSGLPGHAWRGERPPDAAAAHARDHGVEAGKAFWLGHPFFASLRARPAAFARLAAIVADYGGWHWTHANPQLPLPAVADRLGEITAPALVLTGDRDAEGYREIGRILAARLPNARAMVLDGLGHVINMEDPARFNRAVLDFTAGIAADGRA